MNTKALTNSFNDCKCIASFMRKIVFTANLCHNLNYEYNYATRTNEFINIELDAKPPYSTWFDISEEEQNNVIAAVLQLVNKLELMYPDERKNVEKLAKEQHDAWVESKKALGWVYGEVLDREAKTHPDMVEWDELSYTEKLKDSLFVTVVLSHFDEIVESIK